MFIKHKPEASLDVLDKKKIYSSEWSGFEGKPGSSGCCIFFVLLEWSLWDKHILMAMLREHFIRHTLKEIEVTNETALCLLLFPVTYHSCVS